jgi:hypothetical protein
MPLLFALPIPREGSRVAGKAQPLLSEALESYTRIGMPRHIEMTQTLLDQAACG